VTTPDFPEERDTSAEEPGFFAALFDLEFKSFVALRFIKVIYVIAIVFIGLAGLVLFFVALTNGDVITAILALVFMVFYLIMIRMSLEVIALLFRIGQDATAIRKSLAER
jgi:hypothetical protein